MKIEIWSDVICPFCYIGKVKFETALNDFANKNNVEIEWKSYQIMPELKTQLDKNIDQVLAEKKRINLEEAKQLNGYATSMAKEVGLEYNFDKAVVANTLKAHQFLHFAKDNGKQNEAEELMFKSYFINGKNVDDIPTLIDLGKSIDLDETALRNALEGQIYVNAVKADIKEAEQIGVNGVPFFVFNRKYAVSGAQTPKTFLDILQKSFEEWRVANPVTELDITEGSACGIDGVCK